METLNAISVSFWAAVIPFALKVLGAIVIWIVGRWLARLAVRLVSRALERQHFDPTLLSYIRSTLTATLNIVLIVAILGFFGVETTTFAAILASIGVAIGLAWSGLLSNLAAGIFLVVLRPFKTGDFITAGGVKGTVKEVGLFATAINTPDNVLTTVGNNKILSDNIQNFTANPFRRVDLTAQLNHSVDHTKAIRLLKERLITISNVLGNPAPEVEILQFTEFGPVLAVRPYCHNDNYWQVYFETNRMICETFGAAGFPMPERHLVIRDGAKSFASTGLTAHS